MPFKFNYFTNLPFKYAQLQNLITYITVLTKKMIKKQHAYKREKKLLMAYDLHSNFNISRKNKCLPRISMKG